MQMKAILYSVILFLYMSVSAQEQVKDINRYISNQVYKNIAAYNIRYCSFAFNGVSFKKHFSTNSDFFYNYFLADCGSTMEMKTQKIDLQYPDERFHLYEISTDGFNFSKDTGTVKKGSIGPISTYTYLLALNETNGQIKFISGQYFKSSISQDFKFNITEPNSLIAYIAMRAYVIKPVNITFVKRKNRALIYTAYSEIYDKKATIKVPTRNTEDITISLK